MTVADDTQSPFADKLVVILGCARSGTTWLENLLMAHPRVAGLERGETWIFTTLSDLWTNHQRGNLSRHVDGEDLRAALRTFCDNLFGHARDRTKPAADHFVEKTPDHIWKLDLIEHIYPDAWYIHIIRDGREVTRSLLEIEFGPDNARECSRMWRGALESMSQSRPSLPRFKEIRYEDLVDEPVRVTSSLLSWIGLDADVCADELHRRCFERVSQYERDTKRHALSRAELATVYWVAGDLLAQLGYLDAGALAAIRRTWRYRKEGLRCLVVKALDRIPLRIGQRSPTERPLLIFARDDGTSAMK